MANRQKAIVGVPIIVPVVEIQVPLGIVPVEVEHVAVAVDLTNGASCKKPSTPLLPESFAETVPNS